MATLAGWKHWTHPDRSETWESPCSRYRRYSEATAKRCAAEIAGETPPHWLANLTPALRAAVMAALPDEPGADRISAANRCYEREVRTWASR